MSATNRGAQRKAQDLYRTPQWCVDALAERIKKDVSLQKPVLIDPGTGDGRIGNTVAAACGPSNFQKVYLVDTDPAVLTLGSLPCSPTCVHEDYLEWLHKLNPSQGRSYLIPSNPPFSLAEQFVRATVEWLRRNKLDGCAVFLLRVNYLGSKKRVTWLSQNPPSRITVLTPRPSFTGSGSDATEYAWTWWNSGNALSTNSAFDWAVRQ